MARRHADHLDRVAPIYTIEERIGNKLILSNAPRAATAETSP
jgi:hypothetical protein